METDPSRVGLVDESRDGIHRHGIPAYAPTRCPATRALASVHQRSRFYGPSLFRSIALAQVMPLTNGFGGNKLAVWRSRT